MTSAPVDRLWQEVVLIAASLHWSLDSIVDLEHHTRYRVIQVVAGLGGLAG